MNEWAPCQRHFYHRDCKQQQSESTGRNSGSRGMEISKDRRRADLFARRDDICCPRAAKGSGGCRLSTLTGYSTYSLTSFVCPHHIPITLWESRARVGQRQTKGTDGKHHSVISKTSVQQQNSELFFVFFFVFFFFSRCWVSLLHAVATRSC